MSMNDKMAPEALHGSLSVTEVTIERTKRF